jgi:hypothetical protein
MTSTTVIIEPSPRLFGFGWALITLVVVAVVLLIVCLVLSKSKFAGVTWLSSLVFLGVLIVTLRYLPSAPPGTELKVPKEVTQ